MESVKIIEHVPIDELSGSVDFEGMSPAMIARVQLRLNFIKMRYRGYTVREACAAVGIELTAGYSVQNAWNEGGPAAIIPKFAGGIKPRRLTDEQKAELRETLRSSPMCTADATAHIAERYGVKHSARQVHEMLSEMGLRHRRPPQGEIGRDDAGEAPKKSPWLVWTV